ncbi:TPA: ead/Ea22-like family protein [Escherichia coli]|nr:ead/Ea22-like family protein [Escherichia coli]HBO4581660.1 ead/Ea22-like family protein [Escherichia coli]
MSKIDYQALREAAEKATCGEWSLEYGEGRFDGDDALIHREAAGYIPICRIEGAHPESGFDEDFQMEQQANAEFIAAANPATVLTLLNELETAKKRIAELEAEPVSQTYKLNELSGNYPVTPDGWIRCSERMPEIRQTVIGWNGYAVRQCVYTRNEYAKTQKGREPRFETLTGIWHGVTHWMPLPEPPQEVNRG